MDPITFKQTGVYREGPVTGLVTKSAQKLVKGTELQGRLWFTDKYVIGRYTEAKLPDNTRVPVCIMLADPRTTPGFHKYPGSKPDAVIANIGGWATAVPRWKEPSEYPEE
jgi:hypothetical protein